MKLSEIKNKLHQNAELTFKLPNGDLVPNHFHVTEIGAIEKHFIDCGGTERKEKVINFQLWTSDDYHHRLASSKLLNIISLSEKVLQLEDLEIEVEYQSDTIGKYGLDFDGSHFLLTSKQTDCLAKENCGVPSEKPRIRISANGPIDQSNCTPNSGCC